MLAPIEQPLICPRCDHPLARGQAAAMVMHACGKCGGIWLDLQGARRVRVGMPEGARRLAQLATAHGTSQVACEPIIACLICKRPMRRSRFEPAGVDLDRCGQHGTWYDRARLLQLADAVSRLNALQRAANAGEASPVPPEPLSPGHLPAGAGERKRDFIDTTITVLRVADGAVDVAGSILDIADATDAPEAVAGVVELALVLFEFL